MLFAAIVNEKFRAAGRSGVGAVMGSKNLKAIAVRGTGAVRVARPADMMRAQWAMKKDLTEAPLTAEVVAANHGDDVRTRLAEEPLADIIRDILQITRASADEDSDTESDDSAYIELVEYVRVATQLVYEELADLRHPASEPTADALH